MWRYVLFCLFFLSASAAQAKWLEASSEHFVVYADDSEEDVRRFSEQLERYHAALSAVTVTEALKPSLSNRVTVYVVRNDNEVRKLIADGNRFVHGYYNARAGGSVAFVPQVQARKGVIEWSMFVLLHEYAHHYLISTSGFAMPRWFAEGAAEFLASARFESDGTVGIGWPNQHRANELYFADKVTAEELLDPDSYEAPEGNAYDAFYAKSWALYHYLSFSKARSGQMSRYIRALVQGKRPREAALGALGDFAILDRELKAYLRKPMDYVRISPERLRIGDVRIRSLGQGEAAMMPIVIRSRAGVTSEQAAELVLEARAIAAKHPGDAAVLAALAEAEFDSGHLDAAVNAADAALAIDRSQVNAYVQKGYALFAAAAVAKDTDTAYRKARGPFLELNRLENNHPLPLIYFYRSFLELGRPPTDNAKAGLERAAELAPFDLRLRLMVARMQMQDGRYKAARYNLTPVAYNPHGGEGAEMARSLLKSIEGKADGKELAQAQAED